ncbi:guanine nucleotide-binding protein alpha-2 subunit [Coprinopsis cinerea okayama7|uniref:Guanine nucleotide-binding protein alpha-2 subunit n=1 Tax=Coprinopsis cinerea (strain Okayama-7 / 130 / ATCC MYA-4618 / FGSC 9003) TaxID=240176 RepID=A8N0A7_COPC7|nr:guanine nucleotide-binding protein alpha-2 subunit [Coprinopsis cinerea okayama7\|eukprot:XP_001828295.2 guanine nucleotide-binding protein alpha-2 subunit [Coprinopsis cinerea okayama7\
MGSCMSSPSGGIEVTEEEKQRNKEVEKQLKEAKAKMQSQVKVLLLGSGDSGKSTILKQMRLIHKVPFSPQEVESYRQLVFENLTRGMGYVLDAMEDMELKVSEENQHYIDEVIHARDIRDGEPFPRSYYKPLKSLWLDPNVQKAWQRGNEAALPEKSGASIPSRLFIADCLVTSLLYFYSSLDRLFDPEYQPSEQDIIRCRARTIGITETTFVLREHEMLMVDVGGQKSERRKWIHCFQDVTSILFLVSLSGYDQCLVEDKDANQMQDAMTIWDSICHSQWFKQTSIILFLNKNDLFEQKVPQSDIKNFFPDYDGEPGDAKAGRDYFKKRFARLAQKAGRSKEREIYIHITTATDTAMLRVVMAAVEVSFSAQAWRLQP